MEQKKVIYDGDPGHDDAMAILLAEGNPAIDLVGITTVAGNTTLENATKNALMLKDLRHSDVPVSAAVSYTHLDVYKRQAHGARLQRDIQRAACQPPIA